MRVTDLSLLKQCAAEMSQLDERTEAPQYRLPEKWRLTCHGHSPSIELTPPTMRAGPVGKPTFFTGEGRPQAWEHIVMDFVVILVIFLGFYVKEHAFCVYAHTKRPLLVLMDVQYTWTRAAYYISSYCSKKF